jgi:riboflavin kinase/FMN adenylyltransferase
MKDVTSNISYSYSGKVVKNMGRGSRLGFKTANVMIDQSAPEGVFLAKVRVVDNNYDALVFIGQPMTFNDIQKRSEVYILDFDEFIYNVNIKVDLITKIRDNYKFDNEEQLINQLKKDEIRARGILNSKQ